MSDLEELERRIAAIEERLSVESGLRAAGDRFLDAALAQTRRASLTAAHGKLDQIIGMLGRLLDGELRP
jgi:hypothetical protein